MGKRVVTAGYIPAADAFCKGMGSAEGGEWRPSPNKPQDERFLGDPGQIKNYTKPNGELYQTKIGDDGRAVMERHWTDRNQPWAHAKVHDHIIDWSKGYPDPGPAINYPDGDYPEFKQFREMKKAMGTVIYEPEDVNYNFESISDFKWCMKCHGEVQFAHGDKSYSITHRATGQISISEANKQETEKLCDTADEVLEYVVNGERLRDIITKVKVTERTI